MLNWLKKLIRNKSEIVGSAATNKYYIDKYKDFDIIIKTYYQTKDTNNKLINIDGIVNPRKIDNRQQCSVTDN